MTIQFNDLTKPVTREEWLASMHRVLGIVGTDVTTWKAGAVARTTLSITAWALAAGSTLVAEIAKSGFLELARGKWLDLVAWYVFRVKRPEATFAPGEVTLTNTGGGIFDLDPEDLVVKNSATGKLFRNTEAFSLGIGETITIPIVAIEAGSASTSPANTIDSIESPALQDVTVANAKAVVGEDAATDPELRTLCLAKTGSLSPNGPRDAYVFAAREAKRADGSSVGVKRVAVIKDGYGGVRVICATSTGGVTGDADDPATDLGAVQASIEEIAATLNDIAEAESALERAVNVTYESWVLSSASIVAATLEGQIETKLAEFLSTQPIGGYYIGGQGKIYVDALESTIRATLPEIFRAVVDGGDQSLDSNEVAILGTVTPTTNIVGGEP